jgi:class 3 adenylate cyclase/tetratricopeptide (TPR) repeat protein
MAERHAGAALGPAELKNNRQGGVKMAGQRRYVTVLFSDVSGSSEYAEHLEAEDYAALLARFRQYAHQIVPRHGGSIARFQGDGFLALFGHLQGHEDDGRRATEAALELHAAVATLPVRLGAQSQPLQLHSGVHAGLLLVLQGDIERGRVDVVGEVANTAARLCGSAGPGEVLVSAESLGPHADFFELAARWVLPVRGRSQPLNVLRVAGRRDVVRRIDAAARRGVVPFVGRADTLAELLRVATLAREGRAGALLVSGEPGIGKTRLLDEFQHRLDANAYRVMQGCCENYLGAEPLQPFLQALRGALGWQAGQSADQTEAAASGALQPLGAAADAAMLALVARVLGRRSDDPAAAPAALRVSGLIDLLLALAGDRTLVLILDDWQWADDASRHVLEQLRERRHPMCLLLAARPFNEDDHALVGAPLLRLAPLEPAEAQRAIAGWLPEADPFVVQEITQKAGGSPLFIEELCRVAASGSDLRTQPRHPGTAWICALVASRFERLPAEQAECLRIAAVAGNSFAHGLLARLCGPALHSALSAVLTAQDFVLPAGQPGMLRFRHALTRDAVYGMVDPARRRQLHRQVAQSLQAEAASDLAFDPLEALAYHYDAADMPDPASHYAVLGGDKALAAMALDRARALFTTALQAMDALPGLTLQHKARWCSTAEKLGQTCVFDPLDVAHSFQLFERAAQLARELDDPNALARAEYWLAYVNYGKGRPRQAVRHGESALALAQASGDSKLAAQVQATLAQALASSGQYSRALPLFVQAVQSKRQHSQPGSGTAIGSAYTLGRMGYTFGDMGRFDEAHSHFAEALRLLGDKVHSVSASVQELVCAVHLWQGRWEEAEAIGLAGADMALRCRSRYLTAMGRALAACGGWAGRRDPAALQALRDSTLWIESRGGAVSTSLNYGWLVEAAVDHGQEPELRQQAARLFMRARTQDRHGEPQGCRALARWAAHHGRFDRAEHYLARAERSGTLRGSAREHALSLDARARTAGLQGRHAEAKAHALGAAEGFERMHMAWHLAQTQTFIASL